MLISGIYTDVNSSKDTISSNTAGYITDIYQKNIENYKNVQQPPETEFQDIEPEDQNGIAVFKHLRKDNANEENPFG